MLGLPPQTETNKLIPKKALLLQNGSFKQSEKNAFNDNIQSVRVVNEITPKHIAVAEGKEIKSIFIIEVVLKNYEFSLHSIELLFQMIRQNIVLVLKYDNVEKLAVKCHKIFFTEWSNSGYTLNIEGLTFDDAWANFVSIISGITIRDGETLDDAVKREMRNEEIRKSILLLEKEMKRIKTKAKQFDIYNKILTLKEQLD